MELPAERVAGWWSRRLEPGKAQARGEAGAGPWKTCVPRQLAVESHRLFSTKDSRGRFSILSTEMVEKRKKWRLGVPQMPQPRQEVARTRASRNGEMGEVGDYRTKGDCHTPRGTVTGGVQSRK